MSIITVTEKEQQLTHMLRITSEALDVCTVVRGALAAELAKWADADSKAGWINELRDHAKIGFEAARERDALELSIDQWRVDYHELHIESEALVQERDTYQVEADKLAAECKVLRDALEDAIETAVFEKHPSRPWHYKARAALQGANHD